MIESELLEIFNKFGIFPMGLHHVNDPEATTGDNTNENTWNVPGNISSS